MLCCCSILAGVSATATARAEETSAAPTPQEAQPAAVGRWTIAVPGGGAIWATEDPTLGQPSLNVSAPSEVAFAGGRITEPVRFYGYNNYSAFIERSEVLVYRAVDADLVTPIATVPLPSGAVSEMEWDGALPADLALRAGDELIYVVRAYGANGVYDETFPRRLQLVTPEQAERRSRLLRTTTERKFGEAFTVDEALRRSQLDQVFGENALGLQNIPVHGSKVRIQGRGLPDAFSVRINGRDHPIDLERKFVAEYLVPVGPHDFTLEMTGPDMPPRRETLHIDVSGKYTFLVGIADLTVSKNSISGSTGPLSTDDRLKDDDFLIEGRLAFYLKSKLKGRYLLTAQADTQERELDKLFDGFFDADPRDVFRRLDPDLYYPTYGDDSTTYRDVDTQGRLYGRLDWDKNQLLFGNFETRIGGTEYGRYSRSLYGGAGDLRSREVTALGEPVSQLRAFASKAQTAPGHSEFLGTGASLYFLRQTDILPGSDKVMIEVRDPTTGRVERRTPLLPGADYELDDLQGRILLTKPLTPTTREGVPGLITDAPLAGFLQVLVVDYEYVPTGFDPDTTAVGLRGKHWFGEHVGVGLTYVNEGRAGDDYNLMGADITLQAGRGTYFKIEHTRTENAGVPVFYSDNGGLTFTQPGANLGARDGTATAVEARVNLKDLGVTQDNWAAGAWWRNVDGGFSVARSDTGEPVEEYGAEVVGEFGPAISLYARYSHAERGDEALTQAQITGEWRFRETASVGAEIRHVDEQRTLGRGRGTLAAMRYTQQVTPSLELYGQGQVTLDDDGGAYARNDAVTVGGTYLYGDQSSVGAELTAGDRGNAARITAEHRLNPDHTVYATYTTSTDRTDYDPLFSTRADDGWVVGQRWRLSNRTSLFNESQYLKTPSEAGLAHTFGLDFYPSQGWNLGFTVTHADLERHQGGGLFGQVERQAISISGGLTTRETQWQSKLEWREDSGLEDRTQWVTTNRIMLRVSESLRLAGRLNYSETKDRLKADAGARFLESNLGFAYRPWNSTRWALFGKHTYLYDVSALSQVGNGVALYDQRTQVLSLEGIYNPDPTWEFAGKVARREGEVRFGRMTGQWADSGATFLAGQVRLEIGGRWHALAEYRYLGVDDGGTRQGVLIGVDRDIGDHLRIGIGYNFTEFSDDLTDFDYDHRGLFLNVVGRF
ncbi:hypothetical protein CSW64_11360 [Caulobacter mirabilis]|uniref:TonB-dependent receptor n=2 Tax=Caulobacter mirabilis TaxID=69666 RepID=A0A2D2AY76_9CAUL|nr:hypothetical protein CSW64_11360 [Caulobacter mirabilis]